MADDDLQQDLHIDVLAEYEVQNNPCSVPDELSRTRAATKCIWSDITEPFKKACKDLTLGELLHDANFSLVEGMSAIEMMDPKMDAGMSCNLAKHKVLSFQQAVEEKTLKIGDFSPEELIGIIDDSLSCLVTWLEGHSLVQTVFINLYLHDPTLIEDPTLRAFATCLLKVVDIIRSQINWAGVYEEEDFQSMVHNFKLAQDVTETVAMTTAKEAEEEFSKVAKNTRARSGVDRDESEVLKHNLSMGMSSRLKFIRLFYATIVAFGREKGTGMSDAEKHLKSLTELLVHIKSTVSLGSFDEDEPADGDRQFAMGFDPMVNQRLLPPTFPRFVTINPRLDSIEYLDRLVSRLHHITSVTSLSNFHEILDFCLEFSKTSPCLLSRSILQIAILPPNKKVFGKEPITDFIKETIKAFCCPPPFIQKCPLYNNQQVKEFVDAFLLHSVRPIISMIQITGHNRARQRDKWARQLEELGALQDEAEKIDSFVHALMLKSDPNWKLCLNFGTWVLYLVLKVMTLYVTSGLELELYSTYEYSYIFWYLSEGMFNWSVSTIKRAETFHQDGDSFSVNQGAKGAKKGKNKKKKCRVQGNELAMAQALHSLTGGFYKAVIGLRMDDKLRLPKFDFDCEEVRYNHRFTPFAYIATPPMFHYSQFKDHTDTTHCSPPIQPTDLYGSACRCFEFAKRELEAMSNPNEEVKALLKVAKTNLIVMRLLQGGHKKDSKVPPEFSFETHCHYPTIKLA